MAINLKKDKNTFYDKLSNIELLQILLEKNKKYRIKDIEEILKEQGLSSNRIESCIKTLYFIMDGFVDESQNISTNRPITYSNSYFCYDMPSDNEIYPPKKEERKINITLTDNKENNHIEEEQPIVNNNQNSSKTDLIIPVEIKLPYFNKYELMDDQELLFHLLYIDNYVSDITNESYRNITDENYKILITDIIVNKYHLSKNKALLVIMTFEEILKMSKTIFNKKINDNVYIYHRDNYTIVKYHSNGKNNYFYCKNGFITEPPKTLFNEEQKYMTSNNGPSDFEKSKFNPAKDLIWNLFGMSVARKMTNEQLIELALVICQKYQRIPSKNNEPAYIKANQIRDELMILTFDIRRTEDCMFYLYKHSSTGLRTPFLKSGDSYKKRTPYSYSKEIKDIDEIDIYNSYRYQNRSVCVDGINYFGDLEYYAIPACDTYILYNDNDIKLISFYTENGYIDLENLIDAHPNKYIFDIETGKPLCKFSEIEHLSSYKLLTKGKEQFDYYLNVNSFLELEDIKGKAGMHSTVINSILVKILIKDYLKSKKLISQSQLIDNQREPVMKLIRR